MRRFAMLYCLFAAIAFALFALAPAHAMVDSPEHRSGAGSASTE